MAPMGCDQCQNSLCQKTVHTSHIPVYSLKLGVCVLTYWKQVVWGVCVMEMGGMYISVAEMGVCVVEMVLWKCGVCISCKNGGMCCRNGGYMCCGNVAYVSVAEMV